MDPPRKRFGDLHAEAVRPVQFGDDRDTDSLLGCLSRLAACAVTGALFGFVSEKSRAFEPDVVDDQLSLERWILLKVFLTAVSSGMFSLSLLSMIPGTHIEFRRASRNFAVSLVNEGVLSLFLGGSILGVGIALAQSSPLLMLAQIGAGITSSFYTLGGGLAGALCYGLVEPHITRVTKPVKPYTKHFLHRHLVSPYFNIALPLAAVLGMLVFGLELYAPWKSELLLENSSEGIFGSVAWQPVLCGLLIGFLQIPVLLLVDKTLGASNSCCTLASQILVTRPLRSQSPYLTQFRSGTANWCQVIYASSIVTGAYLSSTASATFNSQSGASPEASFLGGILMIFGARVAAGCTSGDMLSGMSLMSLLSMAAGVSTCAGGVLTTKVLDMLQP